MKKTRIKQSCPVCEQGYEVKLCLIKEGKGKYCSLECYRKTRNKPIFKKCQNCNKEFKSHVCKPNNRFCGKGCAYDYRSQEVSPKKGKIYPHTFKRIVIKCKNCDTSFEKCPSSPKGFCTKQCFDKWRIGKNYGRTADKSPAWKGGKKLTKFGYVQIYHPHHPKQQGNYALEHHLVAEKALGRFLTDKEVIHHINEIKDDNRLENLYLFKTTGEHTSYHNKLRSGKVGLLVSNLI